MTIEQTIEILERHNAWRRGADTEMPDPKLIGEAIDKAIQILKTTNQNETEHRKTDTPDTR